MIKAKSKVSISHDKKKKFVLLQSLVGLVGLCWRCVVAAVISAPYWQSHRCKIRAGGPHRKFDSRS